MILDPFSMLDGLGRLGATDLWYRQDMEACVREIVDDNHPVPEWAIEQLCREYRFALAAIVGADADGVEVRAQIGAFEIRATSEDAKTDRKIVGYSHFFLVIEPGGPRIRPEYRSESDRVMVTVSLLKDSRSPGAQEHALGLLASTLVPREGDVRWQRRGGSITWSTRMKP